MNITSELKNYIQKKLREASIQAHKKSKVALPKEAKGMMKRINANLKKQITADNELQSLRAGLAEKYPEKSIKKNGFCFERFEDGPSYNHSPDKFDYNEIIVKLQYKDDTEAHAIFKLIETGQFDKI